MNTKHTSGRAGWRRLQAVSPCRHAPTAAPGNHVSGERRGEISAEKGKSRLPLAGFTLIEMVGILAVLAILATVIVSTTTGSMDIAAGNLESTNLVSYANALQNSIVRNRSIPSTNNVISVIATELGMDVKDVTTNPRNRQRAFIYQPDSSSFFAFYSNAVPVSTPPAGPLVKGWQGWSQGLGGAFNVPTSVAYGAGSNSPPVKCRAIIVSSLGPALPGAVLGGMTGPNQDNDFQNLWDASSDANLQTVTAFSGWAGRYGDLSIQRIDLAPLFVHVILYNFNYPSRRQGQYNIDVDRLGAAPIQVPNGTFGVDTWFLKGTVMRLLKSTGSGSTIDSDQILSRDTSFAYVMDTWRSSINLGEGVDPNAAMFGNALWASAVAFMGSPWNNLAINTNGVGITAGRQVTPPMVVTNMQTYMSSYVTWANAGFPATGAISNAAWSSQHAMVNYMFYLAGSSLWTAQGLNFTQGGTNGP